jgi:hypothetical protein
MEDSFQVSDVVELVETRSRRTADLYLRAGYRLISAGVVHYHHRRPAGAGMDLTVALRSHEYVLGREAATPSLPMTDAIALMAEERKRTTQ